MNIVEPLIMELEYEAGTTRRLLERVPEEHFGWKPHPRSMTLAQLASHLAEIPKWVEPIITMDAMVLDMEDYRPYVATTRDELLLALDTNLNMAVEHLEERSNDHMTAVWRLKAGDKTLLEMPRAGVFRGMILSHMIHHRGQLTVYLRMKDVPLPAIYGPSADEQH